MNMAIESKVLTWDDYSDPFPELVRGKYTVSVSIPRSIRHLFGNGKATTKRYVAGKTLDEYEKKKRSLSNKIYSEFDARQEEERIAVVQSLRKKIRFKEHLEDFDAEARINGMMHYFPSVISRDIKHDLITEDEGFAFLTTKIPYQSLLKLKNNMDTIAEMVWEAHPKGEELKEAMDHFWEHNVIDNYDGEGGQHIIEFDEEGFKDWDGYQYNVEQRVATEGYLQPSVRSFLEDLLIATSKKQNIETPVFPESQPEDFWSVDNHYNLATWWKGTNLSGEEFIPNRKRRITNSTLASVRDDYWEWLGNEYPKLNTRNKMIRGYDDFIKLMGDIEPKKITKTMAYNYIDALLVENPEYAKQTLRDRLLGLNTFAETFALKHSLMQYNPFYGIKLGRRGKDKRKRFEYTDQDLDKIFAYPWAEQELLLLQISLATGMRPNEIALLRWEQILDRNWGSFIVLIPSAESSDQDYYEAQVETSVKNEGSKRIIPLHPDLKLPPKSTGRLFNYTISNQYEEASTSAGNAVKDILKELVPHDRKSWYSLRSTFTGKLNATGISEINSRMITGHRNNNVQADTYNFLTEEDRYKYISMLDLPWLKRVPKG